VFRSNFRGLKWIIIRFIPLFLLLCMVLLVFSVFTELTFTSLNHKLRICSWKPRRTKRIAKEAQNDPAQAKHADKNKYKTQHSRSESAWPGRSHHGQLVVFTTAHGDGRTVVLPGTHGCAPPLLPGYFVFLRALSSSHANCRFCLLFCLYNECIWLTFQTTNSSHFTILLHPLD